MKISKDKYDLKLIVPLFEKKFDILEELQIKHSFEKCKVLDLVRLTPPEVNSKHVYVIASGFMQ